MSFKVILKLITSSGNEMHFVNIRDSLESAESYITNLKVEIRTCLRGNSQFMECVMPEAGNAEDAYHLFPADFLKSCFISIYMKEEEDARNTLPNF